MSLGYPIVTIAWKNFPVIDTGSRVIEAHHSSANKAKSHGVVKLSPWMSSRLISSSFEAVEIDDGWVGMTDVNNAAVKKQGDEVICNS